MSDEYASSGFEGSLVNNSMARSPSQHEDSYDTQNYPPPDDSTSSGGYGSRTNPFSGKAQRGREDSPNTRSFPSSAYASGNSSTSGLVGTNATGGTAHGEDAAQGRDKGELGLDPYDRNPDTQDEAKTMLASAYRERRDERYEGGGRVATEQDPGA